MFAGKKSAQIREILISESAWEEMTCLFAPSLIKHNDVAIQYALMKKSAMLLCENDSHRYSIYKADFIQKHLRMALIDAGHLG
ncbi:GrpB family protein [Klebsiella pneumoniae]